ncbi:MAG: HlyD family efflux transporter periplasmic adaptor subunit [Bdellovibrionales bacterium]|nr:HlyD family efflux transporter periplasmic adaptor subunit [Bdellovibrionales bacterium]
MNFLRAIVKGIDRHRLLSGFILIALIAAVFIFRRNALRNEGVLSEPVKKGSITQSVYGIGTVTANRSFQLKVGITSHIEEVFVKEGDYVQKGDKLVHIEQMVYRAPFSGTITYFPNKVGENVFAPLPALILVDLLDRYVVVSLEQQGALQVKKGQNVKLSFDSIRENNYSGTVESVYSNDNNFLARIDVPHLPRQILPGMTADVAIEIQKHDNVIVIPVAAIEGDFVWLRRGGQGRVKQVSVKLGFIDKDMAEVVSGDVQEGDRLLIRKNVGG